MVKSEPLSPGELVFGSYFTHCLILPASIMCSASQLAVCPLVSTYTYLPLATGGGGGGGA